MVFDPMGTVDWVGAFTEMEPTVEFCVCVVLTGCKCVIDY